MFEVSNYLNSMYLTFSGLHLSVIRHFFTNSAYSAKLSDVI